MNDFNKLFTYLSKPKQASEILVMAEQGHCSSCGQTVSIYNYKLNRTHAMFLRAMAKEASSIGVNDVDISTLGLAYSVRSQVTKMRQHGLIARIKNDEGAQVARHWCITHKGYKWLNGEPVPEIVVVYNNQVLGHDGRHITIYEALGELFDSSTPIYIEIPVSTAEGRVYEDVRTPKKKMLVHARFKGRDYHGKFKTSRVYELLINHLQTGRPIKITGVDDEPIERTYPDIAAFARDWKII